MAKYTIEELAAKIDYTLLRPDATELEFRRFYENAGKYPFATVCIPPFQVEAAKKSSLNTKTKICTVIGFPLGYSTLPVKMLEAREAFINGAAELDVVMNVSLFKSCDYKAVRSELRAIVMSAPEATVKVIIECALLTDDEKKKAVEIIAETGAHFVKTSTGFAKSGATVEDVRLLKEVSDGRLKVKAAGGIKTLTDVLSMLEAGVDRIGGSSGVEIMEEFKKISC